MFSMRFDMRAPEAGAPASELYKAAIDMAEWGENNGCVAVTLCEHHSSDDGYLPSPLILASALASRTSKVPIAIAIFMLPMYDPVKLAEEMSVLDIISGGRVSYVGGIGYVPYEYEMYGVDFTKRGKIAEEKLDLLLKIKGGDEVIHEGRRIKVTPPPVSPGGPIVGWGGGSPPAARRAGKYGLMFMAQTDDPKLGEIYEQACRDNGHEVGFYMLPSQTAPTTTFVAEDVDAAWEELGSYIMHDVTTYAKWNEGRDDVASISFAKSVEELRAQNTSHRIMSVDQAVEYVKTGAPLSLLPLAGGLPPEIAWKYLRVISDKVMPQLG